VADEPGFLFSAEVRRLTRLSESTLLREERLGRFPARVKISSKRVAYHANLIAEWLRDPEAWARDHQVAKAG